MTADQDRDLFLRVWQSEISRAIEIFTGENAEVSCSRRERAISLEDCTSYLWWRQEFHSDSLFTVWTGAPQEVWMALGGESEPAERCRQIYFDILRQTHDGTANALGAQTGKPVRCLAGEANRPELLEGLDVCAVDLGFQGKLLPPLLLAIERAAARVQQSPKPLAPKPSLPLGRLVELELPLAVSLGKAVMPIRDILKITPGSLVELDRTPADYVDLMVHGIVIARGEMVSMKGNYGVRVKEIISRGDRLELPVPVTTPPQTFS